jgi:hypothetical protein
MRSYVKAYEVADPSNPNYPAYFNEETLNNKQVFKPGMNITRIVAIQALKRFERIQHYNAMAVFASTAVQIGLIAEIGTDPYQILDMTDVYSTVLTAGYKIFDYGSHPLN